MDRLPTGRCSTVQTRRAFLKSGLLLSSAALLAACGPAAPQAPPAATQAPLAARTMAPVSLPQVTPAPAAAAPGAARPEPKGKFSQAWQTTISPSWFDPQENPPQITPYLFAYALHDAMVKHMPGQTFAPSLAESYEIAPDFKSAVFRLRPGVKFHDGQPVTPDDVKFTFEQYRGASATVLKAKTDHVETPDERTVNFIFKEPFLDFLMIYGSPASGAGWVVPKAYYEKVGPNGFKQAPIGAGPYRFVKQTAGTDVELEAFTDYWRKVPSVKTMVIKGIPEVATRLALLKTGEVDAAFMIQGELLNTLKQDSTLRMTVVKGAPTWLDMLSLDRPDHPLKDVRVRQAVSLAIDRQAINDAELGGMSPIEGNWVPQDWQGGIERPVPPTDIAQAKKLLAEAGVGDGFEVSQLTPLPPYTSWAERLVTQLRVINVKAQVNTMERGAFYERLAPGPNRLKGLILIFSGAPGDAASRIRENAVCNGAFSGICLPEVDDHMKSYDASTDPQQRQQLIAELQAYLLDQYIMAPVCRNVAIWGFGPRVANNKLEEISGAIPQYGFLGPYEDIQVKDS